MSINVFPPYTLNKIKFVSKLIVNEINNEYSIIGTTVMALEAKPESWIIGIGIAFVVHMVMFELVDTYHPKKPKEDL